MTDLNDIHVVPPEEALANRIAAGERRQHTTDSPIPFVEREILDPAEARQTVGVNREHKPPVIPDGIALPDTLRPIIESYEARVQGWEDAKLVIEEIKEEQALAEQALRRSRTEAVSAGRPAPERPADNFAARIADAEEIVAIHHTVVDRAAAEVNLAVSKVGGSLHTIAAAQVVHDRAVADELAAKLQRAVGAAVSSLGTLEWVDRVLLSRRVPGDLVCYRQPGIESSPADGRWLREILLNSAGEILRGNPTLRLEELRTWLAALPVTFDQIVDHYLRPYLEDDEGADRSAPQPQPELEDVRARASKAKKPAD